MKMDIYKYLFYLIWKLYSLSNAFGISELTTNDEEIYADEISIIEKAVQKKSNASEQNSFLNMKVGIDQNNLWYVNATIANQEQKLRVDVSQPYVWIVNDTEQLLLESSSIGNNEYEISSYSGTTVYKMLFIDNVNINSTAFISNMGLEDVINDTYQDSEKTEISINTFGFFATKSSSLLGAFGLSGKINNTNWQVSQIATNFFNDSFLALETLKNQKTINNTGYSLWLAGNVGEEIALTQDTNNSYEVFSNFSVGSLMLNYVNTSLFLGDLVRFQSIPYYEVFSEGQNYWSNGYPIFPLSGANLIANNSQSVNLSTSDTLTPILLDSRYTNCFLPIDIIQQIAIQTNAFYIESLESWYVNCELGDINAYVEFLFGQLPIKVPLKELMAKAYLNSENGDQTALYFKSASGTKTAACNLKMKPSYLLGFNLLGAPFLKYSYLAADLETNQFALAQAADIAGESLFTMTPIDKAVNINLKTADNSVEKVISLSTISASATELLRASLSTASTSSTSVSSSSATAKFISSGYIPFAKSSNITETSLVLTTFSAASTQSKEYGSNILELFGYNFTYGSIFSNGEIVTATKSFYETNLPSYQWTTVSGSSFLASITSSSVTNSEIYSQYIVTIEYQTQVTKVSDNTTLYGTSAITLYSTHIPNSTVSSYQNKALIPQRYGNSTNMFVYILKKLGLMGFLWSFV